MARETARCTVLAALLPLRARAHAAASDDAAAAAKGSSMPDARPTLIVRVHSDSPELVAAAVRDAVARELGIGAVEPLDTARAPAELTVTYRASAAELAVTYVHPTLGMLTRVVAAAAAVLDVPEAAALLASNLARTAEGELLLPPIVASTACPPPSSDRAPRRPCARRERRSVSSEVRHFIPVAASPRTRLAARNGLARCPRARVGSNTAYGNVGIKLVGRTSYALFALTGHSSPQSGLIGPGVLFGVAVRITPSPFLDTDFGASHLFANASGTAGPFYSADNRVRDLTVIKLRAIARYALLRCARREPGRCPRRPP